MTAKADEYANFKVIRSYVNSIFDWAEELEYIESNKISKTLKRIKSTKKIRLREARRDEDLYLSQNELRDWLKAIADDLENGDLELKDYVLFFTTFFLSDRKSETYALEWQHIDFKKSEIHLIQALDKYGNIKSTKSNKKTIFSIPKELIICFKIGKFNKRMSLQNLISFKQINNLYLRTLILKGT